MRSFYALCLLIGTLMFTGCATTHQSIFPRNVRYESRSVNDEVSLAFKYGLLERKNARKSRNKGIKLVALQITNNTDKDLVFGENLSLSGSFGQHLRLMDNMDAYKELRQSVPTHLLYLLLTPLQLNISKNSQDGTSSVESIPIGYFLGPGLSAGNMIVSGSANSKLKEDLVKHDLQGRVIARGTTEYGIVAVKTYDFVSLKPIVR